jgi:hypothetical protein
MAPSTRGTGRWDTPVVKGSSFTLMETFTMDSGQTTSVMATEFTLTKKELGMKVTGKTILNKVKVLKSGLKVVDT